MPDTCMDRAVCQYSAAGAVPGTYTGQCPAKTGNGAGLTLGIIGLMNKGQHRKPDDWGALRAWAWGTGKALDYFETDPAIDANKVGIEGRRTFPVWKSCCGNHGV